MLSNGPVADPDAIPNQSESENGPSGEAEHDPERERAASFLRLASSQSANGDTEEIVDALRHDPSALVRSHAAAALGHMRDRRAVPALEFALADEHHSVRIKALEALGKIEDESATRAIVDVLFSDADRFQRIRAAWILSIQQNDMAQTALGMAAYDMDLFLESDSLLASPSSRRAESGDAGSGSSRGPMNTR